MTWHCQACTYANINDRSNRCHACGTVRAPSSAKETSAIIDLTEICSPKSNPTEDSKGGNGRLSGEGGGNVMESNRRRRRRKQGQGARSSNETARNYSSESFFRRKSKSEANENAQSVRNVLPQKATMASNANAQIAGAALSQPVPHHSCKQPTTKRIYSGVIGADGANQNEKSSERDNNYQEYGQSSNGSLIDNVDRSVMKRRAEYTSEILEDPAPQKKLKLTTDIIRSRSDRGKRKESKLKKRRPNVGKKERSLCDNGDRTQSTFNADSRRHPQHALNQNYRDDATKHNQMRALESSSSGRDRSKKRAGDKADGIFSNHQKQITSSPEELLQRANEVLQRTFKHKSLRPLQETAVKSALQRKSSIVVMATGGGKSICYQLPALVDANNSAKVARAENSRVTIVVCPLIALMIDQVNNLHSKGVNTAACLSSAHSAKVKKEILGRLQIDHVEKKGRSKVQSDANLTPIQLLYCTPELIQTDGFRDILTKLDKSNRLYMVAIDEAHCLSTWGHDFRPAYRKLTWLREAFPDVPVTACTGTATPKVIQDIREVLHFGKDVPCIMGTFNRPNISYEVRFKESLNASKSQGALADLVAVVKEQHEAAKKAKRPFSGIVYCHKRDDCQSLSVQISKATGLVCLAYHAGLKDSEREETQRKWTNGTCCIAVATVAFGMGIDLPHVRLVVHWSMAKTLEGFYQESGRAGRDGNSSLSVLYYSKDEAEKFAWLIKTNAERLAKKKGKFSSQSVDHSLVELEGMVNYCTKPFCKRQYVLGHFGEKIDASIVCNKTCDYCKTPKRVEREIQASECMAAVVNSRRLMNAGKKRNQGEGQKFHHNPLEDEESLEGDEGQGDFLGGDDSFLGITDHPGADDMPSDSIVPNKGFVKASSVLKKYEAKECQQGKKGGFVNFKTRTFDEPAQEDSDAKKYRAVAIPDHLRKSMPDPLAGHEKAPKNQSSELKSCKSYASESERLKAELEELAKQKAAALAKMGGSLKGLSSRNSSKTLPTPTLSFKRRR